MIDVYDDVLEEHNALLIDDEVKRLSWKYDYSSEPTKPNKHWHVFCGHSEEECSLSNYYWVDPLFQMLMNIILIVIYEYIVMLIHMELNRIFI